MSSPIVTRGETLPYTPSSVPADLPCSCSSTVADGVIPANSDHTLLLPQAHVQHTSIVFNLRRAKKSACHAVTSNAPVCAQNKTRTTRCTRRSRRCTSCHLECMALMRFATKQSSSIGWPGMLLYLKLAGLPLAQPPSDRSAKHHVYNVRRSRCFRVRSSRSAFDLHFLRFSFSVRPPFCH